MLVGSEWSQVMDAWKDAGWQSASLPATHVHWGLQDRRPVVALTRLQTVGRVSAQTVGRVSARTNVAHDIHCALMDALPRLGDVLVTVAGDAPAIRYVLSGRVRYTANGMRLHAELAHARSGVLLWTGVLLWSGTACTVPLAQTIASKAADCVLSAELDRIRGKHPQHLTVYDLCLRAHALARHANPMAKAEAAILLRLAMAEAPFSAVATPFRKTLMARYGIHAVEEALPA